ncbi:MAG: hypothetical protein K0R63_335 [Rickettsiales bacterium]|jgi:putative Ca2+/H+ antiporter (TMEM165/GDT1 family)|nr:hypothetical protein [Rickettsiales bacterium]
MDIFLHSALLVAIGEIGDKTQLLAIILAVRYRQVSPIILGILVATTLNHAIAAGVGHYVGSLANSVTLEWALAGLFIVVGLWVLKPDTMEESKPGRDFGAFLTTVVTFFIAEIGDKTQIATVALAAEYKDFLPVLIGTTTGMLLANIPAVFFGHKLLERIPMKFVRYTASVLFIGFGIVKIYGLFAVPI